ncbi:uncharacterized protein C6orf47 homolog [Megalops cyprinoides]|uniref:uncharacterized protein C6orf47 homolog n=1 Tax=Megalops cyprinoides TaxID=118141 RepID=UPI001863DCC4|nr:uncharacterized protein C6orf47 homolog [Megalops cyprinoides]
MAAVAGRVWGWVRPALSYRPWGGNKSATDEEEIKGSWGWGWGGVSTWVWGGWRKQSDPRQVAAQYWEKEEKIQSMEIEDLGAGRMEAEESTQSAPRWWSKVLPSSYLFWPRASGSGGLRQRKCVGWNEGGWDSDKDGESSDYGTPPPSPTPPSHPASPFRLFARSWKGEVLPEHYEICFNFLRHLFDLFVVGFLWTVSPPVRVVLDVLGVQGALKLWIHGMALFFVSTVGMGGLLWLVQEYLPQFALAYGIVQALVISVSVRQSVVLGEEEEEKGGEEEQREEQQQQEEEAGAELEHATAVKGKSAP